MSFGGEIKGLSIWMDEGRIIIILCVDFRTKVKGFAPLSIGKLHASVDIPSTIAAWAVAHKVKRVSVRGFSAVGLPIAAVDITAAELFRIRPSFTDQGTLVDVPTSIIVLVDV